MSNNPSFLDEKPDSFLIVGIGASAGGVQALKEFFDHVSADSGLAYVVILHLSPDHDSQLAQVLQVNAAIPVLQVTEKVKIEPDCVYVVSPNHHLMMEEDDFIATSINLKVEDRRAPVDILFRTLADNYGPRSVCVVLSGTGANGSMGLKRIKEMGGVVFVQNPREAEFNEMPRNAIATELVDEVLPVAKIPAGIIAYRNSIGSVQISVEIENRPEKQQQALRDIFVQLRVRTGHDFTNYKRATLLRRIERRISIHNLPDLPAYAAFIQKNNDEATALLKDLLISVTNFFRDQKPFQVLEQDIIPAILDNKKSEDQVRIWVAGCATGEEAYSIAILFAERLQGTIDTPKIQIFATDIDDAAIAIAREGLYTINDAADVSPDRLLRFFNKEDNGYRVNREIREMILFANHNFLKDPPFSRLNLVTCRNVLIYLNHTAQERVMETFHFALNSGGFLFLGTSESIDGAGDLYTTFNRENHIFQAKNVAVKNYPLPESVPKFLYAHNLPSQNTGDKESRSAGRVPLGELHQKLLEEYAPPSVVVNEEYEIVHMSEKVGRYFEFTGGEPSQNLLKLVRPEIRLELRSALYQAVQRQTAVETRSIKFNIDHQVQSINIHIRPVLSNNNVTKGLILVIFEPDKDVQEAMPVIISSDEPVAKQLEEELIRLKTHLRSSNEQHEFQEEELKAANEELQAMNEEMRSAAEELETSKEELQSINEELRTVNQELKVKIEEISLTSNNLQNLINSADVGTFFLDRSLRIRLFTPAVRDIFNLIPSDYGRPVSDITNKLDYSDLLQDAEIVLQKLTVIEREVTTTDGRYFMMRLLPYRTSEDRINGVVITFFDVSRSRDTELALRQSEEHLRLLIESAKDYAIFTLDIHRQVISWNKGAEMMTGYSEQEIIGQKGDIIFTMEDRQSNAPQMEAEKAEKDGRAVNERWHMRKDGSRFWGSGSVSPLHDNNGALIGFVKIMRDLTESKEAEERYRMRMEKEVSERTAALKQSREEYASLAENIPDVITRWDKNLKLIYANNAFETKFNSETVLVDEITASFKDSLRKAIETGEAVAHYDSFPTPQGETHFYSRIVPEKNSEGAVETVLAIARDITDLKNSKDELIEANENLELALKGAHAGIGWWNLKTGEALWDENGRNLIGFGTDEESNTAQGWLNRIHEEDRQKVIDITTECSKEGKDFNMEYRVVYDNGEIRHFLSTGHFKKNEKGEPAEAYGLIIDITERKKTEQEVLHLKDELAQRATDKYLTIFNSIDDGFCIVEIIFDNTGKAIDMKYLETNPAFVKHAVLPMPGKSSKEVLPDYEQHWLDQLGHVAKTGEQVQMESVISGWGDQWFHASILRLGDENNKQVAVLFRNITERKKQEEKQQFLLHLSDALRPLKNVREVQQVSSRILREHLRASRVYYAEFYQPDELEVVASDSAPDVPDPLGLKFHLSGFGHEFAADNISGNTIWHKDASSDTGPSDGDNLLHPSLQAIAWAKTLQVENGRQVALLAIHFEEAHNWSQHELLLIEETAERIWATVEKAKAEEALRISEKRFRTLTDAVPQIIWSNDAEGKANYFNQRWYGYSGLSFDESYGIGWEAIVHPDDTPVSVKKWGEALARGEIFDTEYRLRNAAGEYRWFVGRNVPLKDDSGEIIGWFGSATDINDLKIAEEAVRSNADRLQLALEGGKLGTYEYDFQTGIYACSAQHKTNFGYAENEPISFEALKERIIPSDRIYMETSFNNASDKDAAYSTEYQIQRPDGNIRWIRSVGKFVYNANGEPQKMVGITLDITEEKKFTEELSKQVKERTMELQQSNNDLMQFAHVASHDLKEPVRKIKTFNSRILDDFAQMLPEKVQVYLNKINSAADRMAYMIEGVLTYSKLGKSEKSLVPVDLNNTLLSIESDLEVLISKMNASIIKAELPTIIANEMLMYQLFYNLILNSLKFSKPGEACKINVQVSFTKLDDNDTVEIIISDNGIGFEPEHAATIFNTFTRLNPANQYEGTGLGLALCKKIVERHRGVISATGQPGVGAIFTILLPLNLSTELKNNK